MHREGRGRHQGLTLFVYGAGDDLQRDAIVHRKSYLLLGS